MLSIMIVDDDADGVRPLVLALADGGHRVRFYADPRAALAAVILDPPDAIVLDLFMPQLSGPEFLEVVWSHLRLHAVPAVVLTASPDGPPADHARALGADPVLTKGIAAPHDVGAAVEAAAAAARAAR